MKTLFSSVEPQDYRCGPATLSLFTKQLAVLINSGIPIHDALDSLVDQEEGKTLGSLVVPELVYAVSSGQRLSSAMARFPKSFPKTYVALVRGSEESGRLARVLERLGVWLEAQNRLRMEVKKALTYPIFVLFLTGILTLIMFKTFVPQILEIVTGLGAELPMPTQVLLYIVACLESPVFWFLSLNLVALIIWYFRTPEGWRKLTVFCYMLPAVGPVLHTSDGARYSLALSMLLGSGIDVLRATAHAAEASGSPFLKWDLRRVMADLKAGNTLSQTLAVSPHYHVLLVDMIQVGDQTGKMVTILDRCGEMLEEETRHRLDIFVNLLEPIILGTVSFIVGGIMIAVMMPMSNLLSSL